MLKVYVSSFNKIKTYMHTQLHLKQALRTFKLMVKLCKLQLFILGDLYSFASEIYIYTHMAI